MATKKTLKAPARRIIEAMIERVTNEPKLLDQNAFPDNISPVCETPYCAAGHIVYLQSKRKFADLVKQGYDRKRQIDIVDICDAPRVTWAYEAATILGLPNADDSTFASYKPLFGSVGIGWLPKYRNMYNKAKTQKGRVKVFAKMWTKFLEVDGDVNAL